MRIISTNEFRDKMAEILATIARTDTPFVVSRFGKPLVVVTSYKKSVAELDWRRFYGFLGNDTDGRAFLKRVRRSRKERDYVKRLRQGKPG